MAFASQPAPDHLQTRTLLFNSATHRLRHLTLFHALYELVGDWACHTPGAGTRRPLRDLVARARAQAAHPTQSPLPLSHDEADLRRATLARSRTRRRTLLLAAALSFAVTLGAALVLLLGNL